MSWIRRGLKALRISRPAKETDVLASSVDPIVMITHPRDARRAA